MVSRRKSNPKGKQNLFFKVFLWFYAFISVYPLIWMIFYSLKNNDEIFVTNTFGFPTHFRIENYITAWNKFNVPQYFFNSVVVSVCTVVGTIILALPLAYALARMEWKFKNAARIYITIGMFIPVQALMVPLFMIVKFLHINNTYAGLIIPYIAFNLSFSTIVFYGFLRSIPVELEEAACMDGASIYRTFYSIIIPIIKPAISTIGIFVFLSAWNEFPIALMLISDEALKTLPLGLLFFQGQFTTNWGAMGAAMTIASIPTVILYALFSEQVERAMTVGSAVKG
jgi:raffinose/stachyose/melibiose transport system permease protein